ncbi:hypothetical protein CDL12_19589 [Handroanthus impetiginosus]|uniref:Uncharacterized protein n=1 Tax=Handroanthus impetiginosus TaxID=429701 RepID=A0A2G9GS56_9LAMI|nr:hypothetical protein CDL12_19589 [Handroanthus impetiginosus]
MTVVKGHSIWIYKIQSRLAAFSQAAAADLEDQPIFKHRLVVVWPMVYSSRLSFSNKQNRKEIDTEDIQTMPSRYNGSARAREMKSSIQKLWKLEISYLGTRTRN